MSTSLVMFMIIDSATNYINLDSASDFYAGLPTSSCQGENIFGGYQNFGRGYVFERTIQLPYYIKMKLTVQFLLEDSWDYEVFSLYIDGALVKTYSKGPSDGTYLCGNNIYPEIWYDFSWESNQHQPSITIKITNNLDEDTSNESWGFKNFKIQYIIDCFYLYTECNYLGTEYVFCPKAPLESQEKIILPIKSFMVPAGWIVYLQDPNFHGGVKQQYSANQACIDPFSFPKQLVVP